LVGLGALFIIESVVPALAPSYPVMLLGRIVTALCFGSFFGIGSLVARGLVASERKSCGGGHVRRADGCERAGRAVRCDGRQALGLASGFLLRLAARKSH